MEPEIALVAASVETDVDGAGLNLLNPATVEEIIAHPRHGRRRIRRARAVRHLRDVYTISIAITGPQGSRSNQ
jgi:hypothetical protein